MRVINSNPSRSNDYLLSGFDYTSNPDYNQRYLSEIYNNNNFFTMGGQVTTFVKQQCLDNIMLYFNGRIQALPDPRFTELLKYELSSAEYLFYQMLARDTVLKSAKDLFGGEWRDSTQGTTTNIDMTANSKTKQNSLTDNTIDGSTKNITGTQNVADTNSSTNTGANTHGSTTSGDNVSANRRMAKTLGGKDTNKEELSAENTNNSVTNNDNTQSAVTSASSASTNRAGNIASAFPMTALPNNGGSVDTFLKGTANEGTNGTSAGNAMKYASGGSQNLGTADGTSTSTSGTSGANDTVVAQTVKDKKSDTTTQEYGRTEVDTIDGFRDTNSQNVNETFGTNESSTGSANRTIGSREDTQQTGATSNTKGNYDANTDRWNKEGRESNQTTHSDGSSKPFIDLLNSLNNVTDGYKSAFEFMCGRLESLYNQVFGTWPPLDDEVDSDTYPL